MTDKPERPSDPWQSDKHMEESISNHPPVPPIEVKDAPIPQG